jgi:gas vesicle protein
MADQEYGDKAIWFMAGIAIGATVALLYAPATGEQTRRQLARKAQRGRDVLSDTGEDLLDRGREMYERGRKLADEAADMFERGRKIVESTTSTLKG